MDTSDPQASVDGSRADSGHVSDLLPELARGELEPEALTRVTRHLGTCAECREEAALVELLLGAPRAGLSKEERAGALREIARRRGAPRHGLRVHLWRAAAAVVLLLVGLGVWRVAVRTGPAEGWSAARALEAWERDLAELDAGAEEVRLALGIARADELGPQWEDALPGKDGLPASGEEP